MSGLTLPYEEHCDRYIIDHTAPMPLRWYLFVARLPATDKMLCRANGVNPKLFAKYEGEWVRVVAASRFGDVGITKQLDEDSGYFARVTVSQLSEFTDERPK